MAKLHVFAIYDSAVSLFAAPFYMRSRGEAFRAFQDLVNDGKSSVSLHPEYYTMFELGTYEEEGAKFEFLTAPERVALAVDLRVEIANVTGGKLKPLSMTKEG